MVEKSTLEKTVEQTKIDFINSIQDEAKRELFKLMYCNWCHFIAIDIKFCSECQFTYCNECTKQMADSEAGCSECKTTDVKYRNYPTLMRQIMLFSIDKCPFSTNGCIQTNANYDHLKACKYQKTLGSKKKCDKCPAIIFASSQEQHYKDNCDFYMKKCNICEKMYNINNIELHKTSEYCMLKMLGNAEYALLSSATYNVIFIGDVNVGKTSLVYAYKDKRFKGEDISVTMTADRELVTSMINGQPTKICLWSVSGDEKYLYFNRHQYYKDKDIAIIVYDITNRQSFERIKFWMDEVEGHFYNRKRQTKMLLLGNKIDLEERREVTQEEAERFAKDNNLYQIEVSAMQHAPLIQQLINGQLANLFEQTAVQRPQGQRYEEAKINQPAQQLSTQAATTTQKQTLQTGNEKGMNKKKRVKKSIAINDGDNSSCWSCCLSSKNKRTDNKNNQPTQTQDSTATTVVKAQEVQRQKMDLNNHQIPIEQKEDPLFEFVEQPIRKSESKKNTDVYTEEQGSVEFKKSMNEVFKDPKFKNQPMYN